MHKSEIRRLGLVISGAELPENERANINGPCCLEVPEWVTSRLGRYYLYFADHHGRHIKMAYADAITGPWSLYPGGVLSLAPFSEACDHIASPEIFIDEQHRKIRLYFHAKSRSRSGQWTFAALSGDGLHFTEACDIPLCPYYLRIFEWQGYLYGMTQGGDLCRSRDGLSPFETGRNAFRPRWAPRVWRRFTNAVRHVALHRAGDALEVYYSRIGDAPERILRSRIDLAGSDWRHWRAVSEEEIVRPEKEYEGAGLPLSRSVSGSARFDENALRDPYLFSNSGRQYLFYTVRGEKGIAVCELSGT